MRPDDGGGGAEPDPDVEIVRAIAAGDRSAVATLYDRHSSMLLGLALRIVRDRREAEDLLHDVFLEVWKAAKSYDPVRGRVRTWLAVRMRSRALDQQKSARVSRNAGDDSVLERVAAESDLAESPDRTRVRRALGELPPEQRQVLELGYYEGLSCSEIAERIGAPIGTVKSRVAAALGKLRTSLGEPAPMARGAVS
ncbi:MAG: sigma-70 family RNA polymerase sigma factor [Deltaproteobacteria bacterium]|nr:sigma-70 family RNA polymerase sigma factor [Deltaproteobacteria bacterium]